MVCEIGALASEGSRSGRDGGCLCGWPKASFYRANTHAFRNAHLKRHLFSAALQDPLRPSRVLCTFLPAGPTTVKYKLNVRPVIIYLVSLSPAGLQAPRGQTFSELFIAGSPIFTMAPGMG